MTRVGVDIGGTFTDVVVADDLGIKVAKISSTPKNPKEAVISGIKKMNVDLSRVELLEHGTTVTTNALIQKKGGKTGLITTKGFRDLLKIRRTTRGELYNLHWKSSPEIIPRRCREELSERTDYAGHILQDINEDEAKQVVGELVEKEGIESLAIVFINSYVNPENELKVKKIVEREFPNLTVSASAEIMSEWREYERTSTTAIDAYVAPILKKYLTEMDAELKSNDYRFPLLIILANGGLTSVKLAQKVPVLTIGSGPAAGVTTISEIGKKVGFQNLIGLDMGGTSADVSLVYSGMARTTVEKEVEFGAAIRFPTIDIVSIGAGGGSIAWIDLGGVPKVGPRSAGAIPGPVCYERGGEEPTVTDANLVLGRLNPKYLLSGALPINKAKAAQSIKKKIAKPLGMDLHKSAKGILKIVNSNMVNAIHRVSVQRGYDPREFILFAFGGAGPLHAAELIQELGIPKVLVPPHPGTASALGLLFSDVIHDFVKTLLKRSDEIDKEVCSEIESQFNSLEEKAKRVIREEGIRLKNIKFERSIDVRYWAQTHELNVPIPKKKFDFEIFKQLKKNFQKKHKKEFGHTGELEDLIELVNARIKIWGRLKKPKTWFRFGGEKNVKKAFQEKRDVYWKNDFIPTSIYLREKLPIGATVRGPTIIEEMDSTTIIPPERKAKVDKWGNILIT